MEEEKTSSKTKIHLNYFFFFYQQTKINQKACLQKELFGRKIYGRKKSHYNDKFYHNNDLVTQSKMKCSVLNIMTNIMSILKLSHHITK